MMPHWVVAGAFALAVWQAAPPADRPSVSSQIFVGTWVGTQAWIVQGEPPPGASSDQPVSLVIEMAGEKLTGRLTPFMGGDDGAVFTDVQIVGDELRAAGAFGQPPAPPPGTVVKEPASEEDDGPRIVPANRTRRSTWKDTVKLQFVFKADRLDLKGTCDVMMNGVRWIGFKYDLSKKRTRY